jgi:hypothetical protein
VYPVLYRNDGTSCRNISDFLYRNLETILCFITAGLYITIVASRILAGTGFDCSPEYLHMEKNATSVTSSALRFPALQPIHYSFYAGCNRGDLNRVADLGRLHLLELAPPHEAVSTSGTVFDDNVRFVIHSHNHPPLSLLPSRPPPHQGL